MQLQNIKLQLLAKDLLFYVVFRSKCFDSTFRFCIIAVWNCTVSAVQIRAVRNFHVNLSFGLEPSYHEWYVHDFIQAVHLSYSFY